MNINNISNKRKELIGVLLLFSFPSFAQYYIDINDTNFNQTSNRFYTQPYTDPDPLN